MKLCSIEGCGRKIKARSWCSKHYMMWWEHGDPEYVSRYFTLEDAFKAYTEWQGDCLIWTGTTDKNGYGVIQNEGQVDKAHRYAWEREHGEIPEYMVIDHKNHCNPACCNPDHLRLATRQQNNWNRSGARKDSKSNLRNIYKLPSGNFRVGICKDYKITYYGTYKTVEEAQEVRDKKILELFGEFKGV